MEELKPGTIIRFNITNNKFSDEGFALGGIIDNKKDELEIFQKIDMEEFPSFRDFVGQSTVVSHGSYGIVLRKVGMPTRINENAESSYQYYVYEVLTGKLGVRQVFRASIAKTL